MENTIEKQNKNFIIEWIKTNPNFSGLNFRNNSIIFSNGSKLELKNFLISSLLKNPNIKSTIYSMDEYLFYKILHANTEIYNYYKLDFNEKDYIKDIQITNQKTVLIVTNTSKYEIKDLQPSQVIIAYHSLIKTSENGYVLMNELLKKLNKTQISNKKNDIIFFDLINKKENLNLKENNYIESFSKYMYTLMCYQDYLVDDAQKILELYSYCMNNLSNSNNLSDIQKRTLKLYDDILKSYSFKIQKEAFKQRKASIGFSSLALIIISVVVTLSLVVLLIIIN